MDHQYIIDPILPATEIHLIAGSSGAGKTTFMLQTIIEWREGKPILGYKANPKPFAYVSCDRSQEGIERTLDRVGIDPSTMPTIDGRGRTFQQIVNVALANIPGVEVLFIEAIQSINPPTQKSVLEFNSVSRFLNDIALLSKRHKLTIVGTVHSPKAKEGEKYTDARQRVLGSVAWAAFTETILLIERVKPEDVYDNRRKLYLLPRNAKEECFDYRVDDRGRLVEIIDVVADVELLKFTNALPFEEDIPTVDFLAFCEGKSISRRTIFRWLGEAIENGLLINIKRGYYRRLRKT